ncbi:DNA gyrase/topoisomerase IV subunit A [Anaerocolumna xylanovorans]|uniref:DNA topoisomerase (ATP-hydrolyzing) n=1 Tax=Anaerocolumna xylanovorans DSM 12503 TaxID=1121345 RepID=A0A1M7Y7W7_9FIRM|nr:DNA topoisomerase (ATP-hydrolyzing) [Anaerocolumna xylanovorans]SHO48724.1 DNA gyrase subunit A [Anaerocolumna xylanovorans DSM 12503]
MKQNTENIIQMDYSEEMKISYRDYAMSVIIARALPDVRDGLKPVQRRILYAMKELGLDPAKPHRKSARIVGDTMGKYHPHGDSSIYDALVRMTEDYSMSIPLVDGHGNFGSIDGDGSAAMRYTEARLSEGAMTMLDHLEKGLVPFIPNFDDSEKEPAVLPAMIPNLLINGSTGIAVGMATNIPPHNPAEVIDGAIAYLDNPAITLEKLMKYIPGPDFPTGGMIINQEDIGSIYEAGEGKIRLRAATEIENGENGRKNIIITEIPYTVAGNKTKLVESLVNLMKDKVFDEIYDVRDESSKEGIRIVIEVKKDRDIENLLNGLYKKTLMEDTYGVNMLAVKDQQPIVFSLKAMLKEFVVFQEELYTKEYEHLLAKAENRLEIVDGLIRATDVIDLIIEILRGSSSIAQAKGCLTLGDITDIKFKSKASEKQAKTLDFTERQAEAILSMPLSRLIGLEILKLHEENDSLKKSIDEYKLILSDSSELYKVIKNTLKNYKKTFNVPRRTKLTSITNVDYVEEVKIEDIYILIDRFGYTKSIDTVSYSRLSEDTLKEYPHIILCKNTDKLCLFTAEGNMYQVKVSQIPKCKIKDKGALIHTLCKVDKENILTYTSFEQLFESQLVFSTKAGYIKLVSGIEFETNRTAISATKLEAADEVVSVIMLSAGEALAKDSKVIILTEKGASLGFLLAEIPEMKKTGRGVKSIELDKGDFVALTVIPKASDEFFLYKEKELNIKKVRLRKRGQKGQKAQL